MTTTIEQITAIIDEATADERAKVLDLERRLSNAYADLVAKKEALTNVTRDLRDLTVERRDEVNALNEKIGELRVERDIACAQLAKIQGTPVDEATANAYAVGALLKKIEEHEATIESMGRKQIERLTREKATAYRKLAEVSRKCLGLMKESAHLRTLNAKIVDDCNKEIDELNEKCAALVVENKRLDEYASGNWVDVPPPSDAGCLYPECGPICRRDCPPAPVVETPAVEERGPWVVYDPEREYMLPYRCVHKWVKPEELEDAVLFRDANSAQNCVHDLGIKRYRVITLAEARAIEAQKTNG